jgi:Na+/H+ antiporter NhaC
MPHPYGWLSLLPSIVAIVLAVATRRVVLSLLVGVFVGALLTTSGNVLQAASDLVVVHFWPAVSEGDRLRVFCFTLTMGAMIGIIHRTGGMHSLVEAVTPLARTRRSGQIATWVMGLVIFFDDYANTLLLGSTFSPLCDRLRISREKLSYIVDSTAAPVAGLALVSTWVAVEIDYIREGLETLNQIGELTAFDLFVASIPYRFYMVMAVLFVPLTAILGRDFGPMLQAERDAVTGNRAPSPLAGLAAPQHARKHGRWYHAVVPIVITLIVVLGLLVITGRDALLAASPTAFDRPVPLREILGNANSSVALQYGAITGFVAATVMGLAARLLDMRGVVASALAGARVVLPAVAILTAAAMLSRMTSNRAVGGDVSDAPYEFRDHRLYTGDYLKELIAPPGDGGEVKTGPRVTATTLPTIVFVMASVVAFCTGTSWGTMGILMPMVVTLAHAMISEGGQPVTPDDPLFLGAIGGVLAGAVFGDHCSPISDTTVLSSQASGCDHIAHVRTQMPYALLIAVVAIVMGTVPLGFGASAWLLLVLQLATLVGVLWLLGRPVEQREDSARSGP